MISSRSVTVPPDMVKVTAADPLIANANTPAPAEHVRAVELTDVTVLSAVFVSVASGAPVTAPVISHAYQVKFGVENPPVLTTIVFEPEPVTSGTSYQKDTIFIAVSPLLVTDADAVIAAPSNVALNDDALESWPTITMTFRPVPDPIVKEPVCVGPETVWLKDDVLLIVIAIRSPLAY